MDEKIDYKKLGFKCGIEIHQQLETHKLFCKCPSLVNDDSKPDIIFERTLKAVAGETGKIDIAAKFEQSKNKRYIYEACKTSSCLIEYDEEPINKVNMDALKTALEIALLLNAKIIDYIQFMRKTVVDGSNVSGFQRTALIAVDGYIETSKGKVGIETICLEEEAAKKIEEKEYHVKYRLDRLGVPLIEIATDASIKDNEHAKEVASKLGMILRSTNKVKRGIGSIRQDINVSIKGKSRVEIKGFQDLKSIPLIIHNEVLRHTKNKKIEPQVRKAETDGSTSYLRPMPGAARMYPESDHEIIKITPKLLSEIKLPELLDKKTIRLEKELNLNPELAKEIIKNDINIEKICQELTNLEPNYIASTLTSGLKELKRKHNLDITKLTEKDFLEILSYINSGKISRDIVLDLFKQKIEGKKIDLSQYEKVDDEELKKEIVKIIKNNPNAPMGGLMGDIMKKFRGKVEGKKVMKLLKELLD